jgi:prepilin peptidase CpaA
LTGLAALLPLYFLRATGAGDVKLLAALGAGIGPYWAFLAGIYTVLAGAVLAVSYVGFVAARTALEPAGLTWPARLQVGVLRAHEMRYERFPYALAIAVGGFSVLWQRGDLTSVYDYLSGAHR